MGAGILPVAIFDNTIYFLFGKERDRPNETARGWADFGGGREKNEKNIDTASREGAEELSGFLGDKTALKKKLMKKTFSIQTDNTQYTTYLLPIEFDKNLPLYFNNQISFLDKYLDEDKLNNTTMYEKEEIKWFSLNMIKNHKKEFRDFYQEIISHILKNKDNISKLFKISDKIRKHEIV
jgi:hypothetical protein